MAEKFLSIPLNEQETTISYGRNDPYATVWTNDRTVITKLDKLCKSSPSNYKCFEVGYSRDKEIMDKRYKILDKGLLSFRSARIKRELTEEQRETLREQMKARNARNKAEFSDTTVGILD